MAESSFRVEAAARRRLFGYDGLHHCTAEVREPGSVEELRRVLRGAERAGRHVTFRSGGCSLDGQSLNDDLVISMRRFDDIVPDRAGRRVTVGAGASWGSIVRTIEPLGLVPFVTVTTSLATAGGTLSSDCLSRFSPGHGKEGRHVESFDLMTAGGDLIPCSRKQNSDIFRAVIGGLGYLGVVTRITYRLLDLGFSPIRVETMVKACDSYEALARELLPKPPVRKPAGPGEPSKAGPPGWHDAVSAVALFGETCERALVFRSRYVEDKPLRPTLNSMPDHWMRVPVELSMRFPPVAQAVWRGAYELYRRRRGPYIDDLHGYTFFMDGNVRAKQLGLKLGRTMGLVQETFIVPTGPRRDGSRSMGGIVGFLGEVTRRVQWLGLPPTLFDVLYVPADAFLLSASHRKSGFAVTLGFEISRADRVMRARAMLTSLGKTCLDLGGRVHLVKNVNASPEHIEKMYGDRARVFFALKRRLDPKGTLRNSFVERLFPRHLR